MIKYKFVKRFGNKMAGESYPLQPAAAKVLLKKGLVENSDEEIKPKKSKGRPKKSK